MFSGSLGFFCFHFKERQAKNADHVFARRKKRKMAKNTEQCLGQENRPMCKIKNV